MHQHAHDVAVAVVVGVVTLDTAFLAMMHVEMTLEDLPVLFVPYLLPFCALLPLPLDAVLLQYQPVSGSTFSNLS